MNRIQLLDPIVAQRIAAGEVIERPSSVVRELVDNAIDANATAITVHITEGGLRSIMVADNGDGIAAEDLPLCCKSHATSKVTQLEDLYHLSTMGFRGEALYSIAACAKITITSKQAASDSSWKITIDNGVEHAVEPATLDNGTTIEVQDLFLDIPARRMFLKRPSTEATMCKNVISEKALAFPHIDFKCYFDGILRLHLPPADKRQRVLDALSNDKHLIPNETLELFDNAGRFSLYAVASTPACFRSDRSHIKIYVNDRPVEEYSLVQAVTYGYGEMLPGGSFPYCYLFVTVDPTLVDFNIHPTKREVKLRNKAEIHHQVVEMVKSQVRRSIPRLKMEAPQQLELSQQRTQSQQAPLTSYEPAPSYMPKPQDRTWFERAKNMLGQKTVESKMVVDRTTPEPDHWEYQEPKAPQVIYIGQAFNLFLIAQKDDELFLIDQHAAHERILYDELRSCSNIQRLMVPITCEVERDVDLFLQDHSDIYAQFGIELSRPEDLLWEISTIPAVCKPIERQLANYISTHAGDINEIERGIYAVIACHAAIKDGDQVDPHTAMALIEKVFAMEEPCCPHGRTFLTRIRKQELWTAVGRT